METTVNIFDQIIARDADRETTLGNPLKDSVAIARRQNHFATLRDMKGFRIPPVQPKTNAAGLTRGDRKRAARVTANAREKIRQLGEAKKLIERGLSPAEAYGRFGSLEGGAA
jgi:hypothetical protein